ncbi:hypothetical protein DFH27DRAFT_106971 [Peziza echinospora]|nr:hypothetical protein DFH27DRAFT_106971 [Peziza echinospora]
MKLTTILGSVLVMGAASVVSAVPFVDSIKGLLKARDDHLTVQSGDGPKFTHAGFLFEFTSTYTTFAIPDNVVDANNARTVGEPNAVGLFHYGINSIENVICFNITLLGVIGGFQSPARTATHIHEGESGLAGPPRIAFPNPEGDDHRKNSIGCVQGPFTTGITNQQTGRDTGEGFHVRQIEENPKGFFTDSHTERFPAGAVRGQVQRDLNGLRFAF